MGLNVCRGYPPPDDIMRERGVLIGLVSIIILCGAVLYSVKDQGVTRMNFIEKFFGFSPDSGDGSLEVWLVVALAIFVGAIGLAQRSPIK
jgi:hypothetical protein